MSTERKLSIEGMTCNHCVGSVTDTIKKLPGVEDVDVSLEGKSATVRFDEGALTADEIAQAVIEAGYEANAGDEQPPPPELESAKASPRNETARFDISGMTCANCAATIEKGVGALDGVTSASVNFAVETLTVEYDSDTLQPSAVAAKVEELGYEATSEQPAQGGRITFAVDGMHCSTCAGTIESKLGSTEGVKSAAVNFTTEKVTVVFDEALIDRPRIFRLIRDLGYVPREDDEQGEREDRSELYWLLYSVAFTVPIIALMYTGFAGSATIYWLSPMHLIWI